MLSLPLVVISLIACSTAQNGLDNGVSRTRVVPLPYYVPYQLPVAQAGPIRRNPVIISDGGGLRGGSGGGSGGGGGFRGGFGGMFLKYSCDNFKVILIRNVSAVLNVTCTPHMIG